MDKKCHHVRDRLNYIDKQTCGNYPKRYNNYQTLLCVIIFYLFYRKNVFCVDFVLYYRVYFTFFFFRRLYFLANSWFNKNVTTKSQKEIIKTTLILTAENGIYIYLQKPNSNTEKKILYFMFIIVLCLWWVLCCIYIVRFIEPILHCRHNTRHNRVEQ